MSAFLNQIVARAKADKKTIVLPEGNDGRILIAAERILADGLADGNYDVVMKNIKLSYSFPKRWVNRIEMDAINLTVACENAATFTARRGLNPQQTFSGTQSSNTFVTARVFTAGLTFKF